MVNFRVIRVKVVAPEKPLDVNIFLKLPWCRFYCLLCLKISLCWYGQLRYPKIHYVDLDHQSKSTKCWPRFKTHATLSPFTYVLSLSPSLPNLQYLVLSFCAFCPIPRYVLPVLIPHKKHMMFEYDYHWLIVNKRLRMHLLFHLYLEYNTMLV